MPTNVFAAQACIVNTVLSKCRTTLELLMSSVDLESLDERGLEVQAAALGADVATTALGAMLEDACRRTSMADLAKRGLSPSEVRWRQEPEYYCTVRATVGEMRVWTWAYRHRNASGGWTTQVPARGKIIARRRTRSSVLALEWESKVAALHPYRQSADLLRFFSHDKLTVEDNTIARHVIAIASVIKRHWKYRAPSEIAEILAEKATRDSKTGLPLLYVSCDAHCIRQYEDETWSAPWKNVNGVRLWCQDRKTGGIIHIGGDFTVGDCKEVVRLVEELGELGILPRDLTYQRNDGPTGKQPAVQALLVAVTDGAKWLHKRLAKALPPAVWLLDAYHAYEYLNEYAAKLYGKDTAVTKHHYATLITQLTACSPKNRRPRKPPRTWRRKTPRRREKVDHAQLKAEGYGIDALITYLKTYVVDARHKATHDAFVQRLEELRDRMDYLGARARGMQIGSGAMESLHRTGSQLRLKLPGARWRPEAAQAILNLRCLDLAGRWGEFWSDAHLPELLDEALGCHQARVRRAA